MTFINFIAAAGGGGVTPPSAGLVSLFDTLSATSLPFARLGPIAISDDGYTVFAIGLDGSTYKVWVWRWNGTSWPNLQMFTGTTSGDFASIPPADTATYLVDMKANADGSELIVGIGTAVSNDGVVLVFREATANTWSQAQRITSPAAGAGNFGFCVAAAGGRLAVGEPYKDLSGGAYRGRVHIYADSGGTYTLEQSIDSDYPDTGSGANGIGNSVAFDSAASVLLTTGLDFDPFFIGSGVVSTYTRSGSTWAFEDRSYPPQDADGNAFTDPSSRGCELTADGATAYIQSNVYDRIVKYTRAGGLTYADSLDGPNFLTFSGEYSPSKPMRTTDDGSKFVVGSYQYSTADVQDGRIDVWSSEAWDTALVHPTPGSFDHMGRGLDMTPDGAFVVWTVPQGGAPATPVGDRVFMKVY